MFVLGMLTGLCLAIFVAIITLYTKPIIQRFVSQVEAKLAPKGQVFEPEDGNLQEWLDSIKKV